MYRRGFQFQGFAHICRDGRDGTRPLLKICDFGYSKHEQNSSAKTGVGTPVYMAPEVILGESKYDAKVGPR